MKPSRLFWGILFIVLGGLLVAARSFDTSFDMGIVWKLWPIAIVLLGLSIIFKDEKVKWVLAGAAGVLVAFLLYGILSFSWFPWNGIINIGDGDEEVQVQEFTEPMSPDVTTATLRLDAALGRYTISSTSSELLKAAIESSIGKHEFSRTGTGDNTSMYLGPQSKHERHSINVKRARNIVDVALHVDPEWELIVDVGAASADFDLSGVCVGRLDLNAGAASVKLRLGEPRKESRIKLDAGAASVWISVPEQVACEVRFDGGLSSKQLGDFEKVEEGLYRTANFNASAKRILIDADVGVSSFRVVRE